MTSYYDGDHDLADFAQRAAVEALGPHIQQVAAHNMQLQTQLDRRTAREARPRPGRCRNRLAQCGSGPGLASLASGRACSARRIHRHQRVVPGRAGGRLLQQWTSIGQLPITRKASMISNPTPLHGAALLWERETVRPLPGEIGEKLFVGRWTLVPLPSKSGRMRRSRSIRSTSRATACCTAKFSPSPTTPSPATSRKTNWSTNHGGRKQR